MPSQRKRKTPKPRRRTARRAQPADQLAARIHSLMNQAEALYSSGHYREAIAACKELARLDPANAMPDEMIEGCQRRIRTRRATWLGVAIVAALAAAGVVAIYPHLTDIHAIPPPGPLQLAERQRQVFRLDSALGYHKGLEYRWELLDAGGHPVPPAEAGTLAQLEGVPWRCTYTPPHDLVLGAAGAGPATRRLRVVGRNASGRETLRAEWLIQVSDSPQRPRVAGCTPATDEPLALVAGGPGRTFRVSATDCDGGTNLTYEWLLGHKLLHKGHEPTFAYRAPADALPPGTTGRELPPPPPHTLTCRISNRAGEPLPVTVQWQFRVVRSNAAPQFIAFEPELPSLVRLEEGEQLRVTAKVYDPDENETLTYNWQLDGRTISRGPLCRLWFPYDTTDKEKTFALRLAVADLCGATIERSWRILVVNAREPSVP